MGNHKGLSQNFDVKFTNGRADWRTNEQIIRRNDEEIYTPRHISYDWDVVQLDISLNVSQNQDNPQNCMYSFLWPLMTPGVN